MCAWIARASSGPDVPLHFTAFHPDYKMTDIAADAAGDADARARDRAARNGLHYVYTGNVHDLEGGTTYLPGLRRSADRARLVRDPAATGSTTAAPARIAARRSPAASAPSRHLRAPAHSGPPGGLK